MSKNLQMEPGETERPDFKHLERLYRIYGRFAFGLAARQLGAARAEDVVHEAFLRCWQNGSFQGQTGPAFFGWLLKEIQRLCQNQPDNPTVPGGCNCGLARTR